VTSARAAATLNIRASRRAGTTSDEKASTSPATTATLTHRIACPVVAPKREVPNIVRPASSAAPRPSTQPSTPTRAASAPASPTVRRGEAPTRINTPLVTHDEKFGLVKVNPIAAWTDEDMDAYIAEHHILVNPLVAEGYPSIGCAPCTLKPAPGADKRSGRWAGTAKIECGLHA